MQDIQSQWHVSQGQRPDRPIAVQNAMLASSCNGLRGEMSSQVPVVLAGGTGSRLWPASRSAYPKQFLSMQDGQPSLFQQTLLRAQSLLTHAAAPIVVGLVEHRFIIAAQCQALGITPMAILLEAEGRNTAASVALAMVADSSPRSH